MSGLTHLLALLLALAMLGAALVTILGRSLPIAILASGLVSLCASVLFLILAAPDVAMTEAAIGSALTTFLFFFILGRMRRELPGVEFDDDPATPAVMAAPLASSASVVRAERVERLASSSSSSPLASRSSSAASSSSSSSSAGAPAVEQGQAPGAKDHG